MCVCLFMSVCILGELRADGDGPHCIVLWARPTALAAMVITGLPLNWNCFSPLFGNFSGNFEQALQVSGYLPSLQQLRPLLLPLFIPKVCGYITRNSLGKPDLTTGRTYL